MHFYKDYYQNKNLEILVKKIEIPIKKLKIYFENLKDYDYFLRLNYHKYYTYENDINIDICHMEEV